MKKLTLVDIAKILQLGQETISELEQNFNSYSPDKKYYVHKTLWDGYDELKHRLAKLKYEQLLTEIDEGKRELMSDLYREALKLVAKDFEDILAGKPQEIEQIETIREQLKTTLTPQPPGTK